MSYLSYSDCRLTFQAASSSSYAAYPILDSKASGYGFSAMTLFSDGYA